MKKEIKEALLTAFEQWKASLPESDYDFEILLLHDGKVYAYNGIQDSYDSPDAYARNKNNKVITAGYPTYEPCLQTVWKEYRGPMWEEVSEE